MLLVVVIAFVLVVVVVLAGKVVAFGHVVVAVGSKSSRSRSTVAVVESE